MITYGDGEVLYNGHAKGFEMRYRGVIRITDSPDNLYIGVNKRTIIGVMLDATDMPENLFNYVGEFKILYCKTVQNNTLVKEQISIQGVDYWELDGENWDVDDSLWGTRNGTFVAGSLQRFNKHRLVINNNIKIEEGMYKYKDGSPVDGNEMVHIHEPDGVVMTGGVHTSDSVEIYPIIAPKMKKKTRNFRRTTKGSGRY